MKEINVLNEILFDVSSEIVIITGVSGQLGISYARAFLDRGAKVAGIDLQDVSSNHDFSRLYSDQYLFVEGDVTNKKSLENCLDSINDIFGVPSVLVNNAGIDSPPDSSNEDSISYENYPEASWDKVLDVNLKGVHLCCQIFGSAMAKREKGSIINIASTYGVVSPDQSLYDYKRKRGEIFFKPAAYSASKSGILNLTRYLAVYWAKQNVRVNTLTIAGVFNNQEQEFLDGYCKRIPIGRMANPDEYSGALIFLASDASNYMTGSNLIIDGGWTAI